MKHVIALTLMVVASMAGRAEEPTYVKMLTFPEGTDSLTKIEMAGRVVPTPQQLAWQQRPLTAFLHFGMNTFTNREWGDGKESPALFNPTSLDTDQWVKTLKDAGFEMVILTAKHHDGFCLWPTATTKHSVASSPWRDGKGDVVADLRRSCDKYNMKLGLYLSPWDRNAEVYGSEAYNDMFVAQLTELLTNYGTIDEVWFDGACGEGPNGKKQVYDWLRFRDTMRRLQPDAVLAITGDDVRWVGNEGGQGRETEWNVTPLVPKVHAFAETVNSAMGLNEMSPSLGSRDIIAKADHLFWWPAEVDVSIRPGWFYHDNEHPHDMDRMARIYLESVGRNATLLLNIPPDPRGLIADADCLRLEEFHNWIENNFGKNRPADPQYINCVELREDITLGQRVEEFDVMMRQADGTSKAIAHGTTIGNRRLLMFPPVAADSLALCVLSSRGPAHAAITGKYFVTMPAEAGLTAPLYPTLTASHRLTINLDPKASYVYEWDTPQSIAGFTYKPDTTDGKAPMYHYSVSIVDSEGRTTPLDLPGEFGNIAANPITQEVIFKEPVEAKGLVIECIDTTTGQPFEPAETDITILVPKQ